jgi:hypothetical protein
MEMPVQKGQRGDRMLEERLQQPGALAEPALDLHPAVHFFLQAVHRVPQLRRLGLHLLRQPLVQPP